MAAKRGTVTREKLIELYVNDPYASMQDVADKLGVHRATVVKAMARFGLQGKPPGAVPGKEIPELSDREWLAEQLAQKTFRQLAKELDTSVGRIADRAYRYGIKGKSSNKSESIRNAMKQRYPNGRFGEIAGNWQGGRREVSSGYIYAYAPDHPNATQTGYVMEHRLVMEQNLGRYLTQDEIVHHIDGNKQNNHPDNLEVKHSGQHISDHFQASHEVTKLRKRVKELEEQIDIRDEYIRQLEEQLEKFIA